MNIIFKIYALINPLTDLVYYIGATSNVKHRFAEHCKAQLQSTTKAICSNGLNPELIILDECEQKKVAFYESYWIQQFLCWGFILENKKINTIYNHGKSKVSQLTEFEDEVLKSPAIKQIRRMLEDSGLTYHEISKRAGLRPSTVQRIKSDSTYGTQLDLAIKVLSVLGHEIIITKLNPENI